MNKTQTHFGEKLVGFIKSILADVDKGQRRVVTPEWSFKNHLPCENVFSIDLCEFEKQFPNFKQCI